MKVYELLERAKQRIDTPDKWCQNRFWEPCAVSKEKAQRFCMEGAIIRELKSLKSESLGNCIYMAYSLLKSVCEGSIQHYNDHHSHQECMDRYDQAINRAKEENL